MKNLKRSVTGSTNPALQEAGRVLQERIESAVGGSPAKFPGRYAERSPDPEKIAEWDRPFLIMHGGADTIVPVQQSCDLARKSGEFQAYRFDTDGDVVPKAPPRCEGLTWNDSPKPEEFEDDRYLFVYDKIDHYLVANNGMVKMTVDMLQFLEARLPPT
jgi:hypothetical protein